MIELEVFRLFGSIFVDTDEADRSIAKTGKEADGLGKRLGSAIKTAGKWALGISAAAAGVGAAAFAMTSKVTSGFDDISKSSQRLGVTTDFYQEMSYWADQNGIAASSMERAVGRLNQRIGMAADGNDKYASALERLGVRYEDVETGTVSTEDAMATALQTLSEMESESEKAAAAADLFGTRMGRDLMTALQDGSMSIDEAKEAAKELGIVIGEDTLNAGVEFQDNLTDLKAAIGGVTNNIVSNLIPVFNSVTNWILDNMPTIQSVLQKVFDVVSKGVSMAVGWIQTLISFLMDWYSSSEETLENMWGAFEQYLGFILDYWLNVWEIVKEAFNEFIGFIMPIVEEFLEILFEFWESNGEKILNSVLSTLGSLRDGVMTVIETVKEIFMNLFEIIVPFFEEKMEQLFEFWEEHGDDVVNFVIDFVDSIVGWVEELWAFLEPLFEEGLEFLEYVWDTYLSDIIDTVIDFVLKLIEGIGTLWTDAIEPLISWLIDDLAPGFKHAFAMVTNILDPFLTNVKNVFDGVMRAAGGLIDFIVGVFTGDWGRAWEGVKDIFGGVFDSLVGIAKAPINLIIGFINGLIDNLNSVNIPIPKVPDWIPGIGGRGGGSIGFNIPKIPSLATGGIVHDPTLALVGDAGQGNPEIVTPEKMLRNIFDESLKRNNTSNNEEVVYEITINIPLDGREFIKRTIRLTAEELERFKQKEKRTRG